MLPFMGCGGNITFPDHISANWGNLSDFSAPLDQNTSDIVMSFFVNATRKISASLTDAASLYYRINSGSWVAYTAPFFVTAGETLGWRVTYGGSIAIGVVTIRDEARSEVIDTFNYSFTLP